MELIPMAVPDKIQQERLVFLKKFVLNIMQDMEIWQDFDLEELSSDKIRSFKEKRYTASWSNKMAIICQ